MEDRQESASDIGTNYIYIIYVATHWRKTLKITRVLLPALEVVNIISVTSVILP